MRANTPQPVIPAVFAVDGDLTGPETSALAEKMWPHLLAAPSNTVLDLSAARALDHAGIDLLAAVQTYTAHRGLEFSVINVAPGLQRALVAAGVNASAPQPDPMRTDRPLTSAKA